MLAVLDLIADENVGFAVDAVDVGRLQEDGLSLPRTEATWAFSAVVVRVLD